MLYEVITVSTDPAQMKAHAGSFAFILDTIAADHDINAYLGMLGLDGELTLVGAPETPLQVSAFALLFGRKKLSGSLIGGIRETQEMLDFCGAHNITADVEVIPIKGRWRPERESRPSASATRMSPMLGQAVGPSASYNFV